MAETSADRGDRKRNRAVWRDPRLGIGVGLIVLSIAGVTGLVASIDNSTDVLAARSALTPGERVTRSDFVIRPVRVDDAQRLYLSAEDIPSGGVVLTRTVSAGELVPVSAVGRADSVGVTSLVIALSSAPPSSVGPGSPAELWSARAQEGGKYDVPTVLVSSATVVRIIEKEGIAMTDRGTRVEISVPRASTARVLEAVANDAALSLVPNQAPLRN